MTPTKLVPGQLVRHRETKSRWYFALVRRVVKSGAQLRFFDGQETTVPVGDVESVDTFLGQRERAWARTRAQLSEHFYGRDIQRLRPAPVRELERAWSRTRAQLSEHFYGREIQRLRPARVREMKRALTRAGISIEPDEWPTA